MVNKKKSGSRNNVSNRNILIGVGVVVLLLVLVFGVAVDQSEGGLGTEGIFGWSESEDDIYNMGYDDGQAGNLRSPPSSVGAFDMEDDAGCDYDGVCGEGESSDSCPADCSGGCTDDLNCEAGEICNAGICDSDTTVDCSAEPATRLLRGSNNPDSNPTEFNTECRSCCGNNPGVSADSATCTNDHSGFEDFTSWTCTVSCNCA
jgi:hypothetical protein